MKCIGVINSPRIDFQVALNLLVIIASADSPEPTASSVSDPEKGPQSAETPASPDDTETAEESGRSAKEATDLPILPPIILLDFGDDNATTSDEKSKRTVDSGLGYGYLRNNLLNGKYNYYFPGGKTGTTVSIEESISPFEPKTIIEPFKPITEQPTVKQARPHQQSLNHMLNHHQVYGQRTRLQKYSPPDAYNPQGFTPSPKSGVAYTTLRPEYKNAQNPHSTPKPQETYPSGLSDYTSSRSVYDNYQSTPSPTASYDHQNTYNQRPFETTTARPLPVDPAAFNLPRYTIENGIKYENKIVWRYQDGRIANGPPSSFVNSYSEYSSPQASPHYQSLQRNPSHQAQDVRQETAFYENRGQEGRYQEAQPPSYQNANPYQNGQEPVSNIHNQRPAQFPVDQDSRYQQHSSSSAYSSSQPQPYDLSYQQKYGFRPRENHQASRYEMRPVSKYAVDSPNAETTPTPDLLTPSGQLKPNLLSKYTPQAQRYLTKVFGRNQGGKVREEYPQPTQYPNSNYENLLNYNPSISQYIRDPSSILNAQPTFIQAGNSLIPVIILRVDGAPPVQTQPAPSINLKALLQQYLSQYADSKATLSQTSRYEYKGDRKSVEYSNPVNDLTRLAHVLSRYSQKQEIESPGDFPTQKLANHPLDYESTRYHEKSSYDTIDQERAQAKPKYGARIGGKQKVKSVQIIENS
ncbi:uncharacterized protein LOC107043057 [Diachasma alloeum]|uniref:uncharacterized protein LOC107043057 n=1 Tax=Diachasma alloeum TaxID=454923 RepID=UPI000738162D|nr:uncharacterized protein LOC107043057 [Diachasma alloeum]